MSDHVLIVSSDCHWAPDQKAYHEYLEAEYLDELEDYWRTRRIGRAVRRPDADYKEELREVYEADDRLSFSRTVDGSARLEELAADGIVTEVVFPNGGIPFTDKVAGFSPTPERRVELARAGRRAYNRWLLEACEPNRQVGLPLLDLADVEGAVAEARSAGEKGARGVLVLPWRPDLPPFDDNERYEPLWIACEEEGLAVHFHGGLDKPLFPTTSEASSWAWATEIMFHSHRPFWFLIWAGVMERHPELQFVFTEQGATWPMDVLAQMDYMWRHGPHVHARPVPLEPSEYWNRQCWIGASVFTVEEARRRKEIGVDRMMFGADFPHSESTWRRTRIYLRTVLTMAGVDEEDTRKILGLNAARLYRLDTAALAPLVEQHGLTTAELLTPLAEEVTDPFVLTYGVHKPATGF